jgi:hypothetical protein
VLAAHFFRMFGGDGALVAGLVAGLVGRGWPGNGDPDRPDRDDE